MAADPRVIATIRRVARQRRVSPKELLAAFETGIVESGMRNLNYGDADSKGWRQERASLYKNPTNLVASVNRFFDETAKVKHKYARAGDLAAAVQRPRADLRGRYHQERAAALKLLGGKLPSGGGGSRRASARTADVVLPGAPVVDEKGFEQTRREYALGRMLAKSNPNNTLLKLGILPTEAPSLAAFTKPGEPTIIPGTAGRRKPSPTVGRTSGGKLNVKELFWQGPGGINMKDGKKVPQGFVDGHDRHVHAAAPTEKGVLKMAKIAQEMGLDVGEHPKFGGVGGGHVKDSNHYYRRAIDVTGPAAKLRAFARRIASLAR